MFDWLNNLGNSFAGNPALLAATLTGSVTFVAGMSSQVLSHRLTNKRERKKAINEAIIQLYSPLCIAICDYLRELGNLSEAELEMHKGNISKAKRNILQRQKNITKIRIQKEEYATLELVCIFQQIDFYFNNMYFFRSFLEDFIKVSKEVKLNRKFRNHTLEELLYLLRFHQLVSLRYGKDAALYTFHVMKLRTPIPYKKVYKQLQKQTYDRHDVNQNSFDITFKALVLDEIPTNFKEGWKTLIDLHISKLKARASK
ncbi:hypothetical protein [Bacillus sp. RC51]|uniref:hypothetical protein n=1 Tax=Bacillus sp. RC51 TaxID=3156288 RepID=UPI00383571F3